MPESRCTLDDHDWEVVADPDLSEIDFGRSDIKVTVLECARCGSSQHLVEDA